MEVTNVQDKVTHAIIGKGTVESFGMSEDAELYHILSSALYSRKKEACVREVLCNAWDSHVDSGITNIPITITLTGEKLIIRDYGAGLAPEQIKPVYGTYGRSTKKHDGKQTGGFGLGSKAPFAYVDHFEVISCHQGLKTIYKMSQSNAEVGGKPSISTIVSVPSDETGLQVTVSLKDPEDRFEFEQLIARIVEMGDMNATLNGNPLNTIPFNEAKNGFMFVKAERFNNNAFGTSTKDRIYIRYGHVIYPLNVDDRFGSQYKEVEDFLGSLSGKKDDYYARLRTGMDWVLILQAEPHTISVTPSREDLSMTDKTVSTVKELLDKFITFSDGKLENNCIEMFEDAVSKTWLVATPKMLFDKEKRVPLIERVIQKDTNFIYNFDDLSRRYMKASYPNFPDFRARDLTIKVDSLIQSGFGNRGMLQSFKNTFLGKGKSLETPTGWFHRKFVNMALRGISQTKAIDVDKLFVYTIVMKGRYQSSQDVGFAPIATWRPGSIENCLPFLRNLVILTHTRSYDTMCRLEAFPICKHWLGEALHSLCYAVPRNSEKVRKAREHFERLGFTVLDLTVAQPWEHATVMLPTQKASAKPRKKGLVCLKAGISQTSNSFNTDNLWVDDAARIEKPEFVVKISSNTQNGHTFPQGYHMGRMVTLAVARIYGKFGGVVHNVSQEQKFLDAGAKPMKAWIVAKLLEEYKNNPLLKTHYENTVGHRLDWSSFDRDRKEIFHIFRQDPELRKQFKLSDPIGQHEEDAITIFEDFGSWDRDKYPELKEIDKLIKSWAVQPDALILLEKIKKSTLVHILDEHTLESYILNVSKRFTPKQVKAARDILLLALEG